MDLKYRLVVVVTLYLLKGRPGSELSSQWYELKTPNFKQILLIT